jgi:hypothetical protein
MTLETAVWSRSTGDVSVIKVLLETKAWMENHPTETVMILNSANFRLIAKAVLLANNSNVIIWICCKGEPPPVTATESVSSGGSLLISHCSANISPKSWREIRRKLIFKPKRWQIVGASEFGDDPYERIRYLLEDPGTWRNDGHTIYFSMVQQGINRLADICWYLGADRREMIDMNLGIYLFDDSNCRIRFYHSSFRKGARLCWETDEQRAKRVMGVRD